MIITLINKEKFIFTMTVSVFYSESFLTTVFFFEIENFTKYQFYIYSLIKASF